MPLLRPSRAAATLAFVSALAALPSAASAEDAPKWELGLGAGVISFPSWRGSDEVRHHVLPVPYVVYRGERLRADRRGLRGMLIDTDRVEFGLSLSASPPVDSSGSTARAGMPDLKATAELGPLLDVTLWRSETRERNLRLRLPLRSAFTLEGRPQQEGWVFSPNLNLDVADMPGAAGWRFGFLAGPIFANRRQHAYFYEVRPEHATAARPAYAASGGYSGSQFVAAASRRYPGYWVGAFVRYDALQGAAFEDSPLVARRSYLAGGIAISWILGQSAERVTLDD